MGRFKDELINIIKHYRLDSRYPQWKEYLFLLEQGIYPEDFCRDLLIPEARRDAEQITDQGNFLWRPPEAEELNAKGRPDVELGNLVEGDKLRIGICFMDRPRNIILAGSAGMGKSVTCKSICLNVCASNQNNPDNPTCLIVIDPKTDYPQLADKMHGDVVLLSANHNLRVGPNGPVDVPPNVWIGILSVSIAARLGMVMSRTCLASIIRQLLVALNPWLKEEDLNKPCDEKPLIWPSLKLVLEAIKIKGVLDCFSSKASYGQTLIQALEGLVQDSGEIFNCSNGLDINKDIIGKKRHLIVDVSNQTAPVVRLISDILMNQVLVSRLYNNYKCDHTDVFFIGDEGDLLVEAERELAFPDGMSPGSKVNRLGRELGIGTIFLISGLQKAGEHILRNACYTFVFGMSDAESVHAACRHLQIDPRCQRLLGSLLPGQCLFRQTQSSWNSTVLCEMDNVEPPRNTGQIEYKEYPCIPATKLADLPHVRAHLDAVVQEHNRTLKRQSPSKETRTKQLAMQLLRLAVSNPYVPVARLFEKLDNPTPKTQIAVRKYLEKEGYAKFEEPRIGRSNRLLIEITLKGYETMGLPAPDENKGRGGIAHRHFAHWIKLHFQKEGRDAYLEWVAPGSNHPVDVAVPSEKGWDVFEICVTALDIVQHIEACFKESKVVHSMTVITGTQNKLKEIKKAIRSNPRMMPYGSRIRFNVIESYVLKELRNEDN